MIGNVYEQFLSAVAEGRKLPKETVRPIADGRVLTGEQAFQAKLVDKLGGVDVALDQIKELAKIDAKTKINLVYPEPKKRSILEVLGQGAADSLMKGFLEKLNVGSLQDLANPGGARGLFFL
jgi:protease-4